MGVILTEGNAEPNAVRDLAAVAKIHMTIA